MIVQIEKVEDEIFHDGAWVPTGKSYYSLSLMGDDRDLEDEDLARATEIQWERVQDPSFSVDITSI